ncbi:hypothetical protein [Commensalibacter nepenthis]|uniref:Uncharacterized protein n=1 Tax=Commensalibacter nepenthis TaxID=3043872 RepID=A0ABT6Q5H2_9PROT|nr:hypothetical protein [Commensalibacter sp. TBRC 10068]MDI2112151.1 hypothetical protein [Commensalibacter sp. TBRC 10068]
MKDYHKKNLDILAGLDEFVAIPRVNRYEKKGVHKVDIETA